MLKILLCYCSVLLILTSCKPFDIGQSTQTKTTYEVSLGAIGSEKDYFLQKGFHGSAVPSYKSPIKVSVITKPFNKQTYKAFVKAKTLQSVDVMVDYIDSIPDKPVYVQLQIVDKIAIIKALNGKENKDVKDYLSLRPYADILTSISLVYNAKDMEAINDADAIFLEEIGLKTYALQLYKDSKKTETIPFNRGIVFEYKASNCCWKESEKHQIDIVDLVNTYSNCPHSTYRSAKRAKKTMNYYKL